MRKLIRCSGLLVLALVLASCGGREESPAPASTSPFRNPALAPKIGREVPEIDGVDMAGQRFKLSDFRGKVAVVDFWGFWCVYCVKLIPHEKALVNRMAGRPFVLLGVNSDHNRTEAEKYSFDLAINWRSWWDGSDDGPIHRVWQPEGFPMLYVIDHRGILRYKDHIIDEQMESVIERLVRAAEGK
jgi:thiol-disulfide isomerase/thioredoxin